MIYEEYYKSKITYNKLLKDYEEFLDCGYCDKLPDRLLGYKLILEERKAILDEKKIELEDSKDVYDEIYRLRWIEHYTVNRIRRKINYSQAQTYRFISEINKKLKMIQNDTTKSL